MTSEELRHKRLDAVFALGALYCDHGKSRYENPFDVTTEEYEAWDRGHSGRHDQYMMDLKERHER